MKQHGGGGGGNPNDIFDRYNPSNNQVLIFGIISFFRNGFGGFNFGFGEEQQEEATRRGDDVVLNLEISLKDAYVGKDIEVCVGLVFIIYCVFEIR